MNPRFVTLAPSDSSYKSYATGTFSNHYRAMPVRSFNSTGPQQRVTFQIVPVEKISRPSLAVMVFYGLRLPLLTLSMGPVLVTAVYLAVTGQTILWGALVSSVLAVVFFHCGVFLLNDYYDHLRGMDGVTEHRGSQVIQRGWVPAYYVQYGAWLFLALGVMAGLPVVWQQPRSLVIVACLAFFGLVGYSYKGRGLKYLGWGDVIIFLCAGPLLTFGFSRAAAGFHDITVLLMGVVFGTLATVFYHCRQVENLFAERISGSGTLIGRLGFDRAKKFVLAELVVVLGVTAALFFHLGPLTLFALLVFGLDLVTLAKSVYRARSPVSSELDDLNRKALMAHLRLDAVLILVIAQVTS